MEAVQNSLEGHPVAQVPLLPRKTWMPFRLKVLKKLAMKVVRLIELIENLSHWIRMEMDLQTLPVQNSRLV